MLRKPLSCYAQENIENSEQTTAIIYRILSLSPECYFLCISWLPQVHLCDFGNSWGNHHSGKLHVAKYLISTCCSAWSCPNITTFYAYYKSKTLSKRVLLIILRKRVTSKKTQGKLQRFIKFWEGPTSVILKVNSTFSTP